MSALTTTRVAIVGAGIGGLTLARILQIRKLTSPLAFKLFESDANASLRGTFGGSLDLKLDSGQRALHAAALHGEFLKLCRPAGGALQIRDHTGKLFLKHEGSEDDMYNPEIDREQLRSLLIDSLHADTVQWGHKATAITRDASTGKYAIEFASGKKEVDFDIVVGADGAWSRVRSLAWPGAAPAYSGVTFLETKANLKDHPDLLEIIGEGSAVVMGEGKCIMPQMSAFKVLTVYSALRVPEDWSRNSNIALAKTDEEKMKLLLDEFAGWDETMLKFIRVGSKPVMRPIHALPHDSQPRSKTDNVVLLGDAAHLMSPFAGAGVNMAMADGADLADVLVTGKPLEEYEKAMRVRSNAEAADSASNLEMFFSDGAAQKLTDFFKSMERYDQPPA
uniref:Monooxygenase n=1 Tax=Mycena chlorophos TaxID=658473 RepID=A0ABQ0M3X5_MYCCL|nr:monooxygenase [Mycena chlorophos]